MKATRFISIVAGALVLVLAVGAFVLSYDALRDLAIDNGVNPRLAWMWPLTIDGFLLVASLAVVCNNLLGERARYQWTLVILFTGASVIFNVLHSPDNLLAQIIGAVPPVAMALAFELAMSQLKGGLKRSAAITTLADLDEQANDKRAELADLTQQADKLAGKVAGLQAEIVDLRKEKRTLKRAPVVKIDTLEQARATRQVQAQAAIKALLAFYADNPKATQQEAGDIVGRSRQWVSATLADLEASGAIERNGNGVLLVSDNGAGG
ncbi:MAG: DUF2637 domain-containing protein [Chloroflexi bacterium]|nr:DUF2637 domain-containing protein [Chloroflexota bacterium]